MSRIKHTKAALEAAFRELLEDRPLSKITVNSIVERCGVSRNTFCYYFEDIPSLLEQLIKSRADEIIRTYSKFGSPLDWLNAGMEYDLLAGTASLCDLLASSRSFAPARF